MATKLFLALPLLAAVTGCQVGGDPKQDVLSRLTHGAPVTEDFVPVAAVLPAPAIVQTTSIVAPVQIAAVPPVIVPALVIVPDPPPCVPVFRVTTCPEGSP